MSNGAEEAASPTGDGRDVWIEAVAAPAIPRAQHRRLDLDRLDDDNDDDDGLTSKDALRAQNSELLSLLIETNSTCDQLQLRLAATKKKLKQVRAELAAAEEKLERARVSRGECTLCSEAKSTVALVPCGHVCCCPTCADCAVQDECPVCRTPIRRKLKLFEV